MKPITIGVITYNEGSALQKCLDQLLPQLSSGLVEEIIIVDNGSGNITLDILEEFTFQSNKITFIKNTQNNLGLARQIIVENTNAPLLVFVDGDCLMTKEHINQLYNSFTKLKQDYPKLAGIGAGNRIQETCNSSKTLNMLMSNYLGHGFSPQAYSNKKIKFSNHLPTTHALFNVEDIRAIGNFSDEFKTVCEDFDLGIRLNLAGYKLAMLPLKPIINNSANGLYPWTKRMFRFGQGNAKILLTHKTINHLPSLLSVPALLIFVASVIGIAFNPLFVIPIFIYLTLLLLNSAFVTLKHKKPHLTSELVFAFILTHFSYAIGTTVGLLNEGILYVRKSR